MTQEESRGFQQGCWFEARSALRQNYLTPDNTFLVTPLATSVRRGKSHTRGSLGVFSEYHGFVLMLISFRSRFSLISYNASSIAISCGKSDANMHLFRPIDARGHSCGAYSQTVSAQSPSRISSSAVMSGQRSWRAVATMALSAGSRIAASDTDSSKTSNV